MSTQSSGVVSGRGILRIVKTNSFAITKLPKKTFYHYDVIFKLQFSRSNPDGPPRKKDVKLKDRYMEVMSKLHDKYPNVFNPRPSFDGVKNMFSSVKIDDSEFTVQMTENPRGPAYEIHISLVNTITPNLLTNLIAPGSAGIDTTVRKRDRANPTAIVPVLNANAAALMLLQLILIQEPHMKHNFSSHSRSFYVQQKAKSLSRGLQVVEGFFQSVRPVLGRFIINVDTTTAAFYKSGWLLALVAEFLRVRDFRAIAAECQDQAKFSALRSFLRGLIVQIVPGTIDYNRPLPHGNSYRKLPIRDIVRNAGNIEFMKDNRPVTIRDYWQEAYNCSLLHPNAFGIKNANESIFPAEKCWVPEGQHYSRRLSPVDMASFLKVSVLRPEQKLRKIEDAVVGPDLNYQASHWMNNAEIRVDPKMLTVQGREITAPGVEFGDNKLKISGGAWNVMRQQFSRPAVITAWAVVNLSGLNRNTVQSFVYDLQSNMRKLGMRVPQNAPEIVDGNPQSPQNALEQAYKVIAASGPNQVFILALLPEDSEPARRAVKFWGDVIRGVPTQCLRRGKFDSPQTRRDQYCNNVALKINPRMGGFNSSVLTNSFAGLKHSIVIGCDISHPGVDVHGKPSIASLVASLDANFSTYTAHVRCQDPRLEVIQDLKGMISAAINDFRAAWGGNVPWRIVIYRDGVSEGEYWRIMQEEIGQVEQALYEITPRPSFKPQVVFIVVGKRHHVRFFPAQPGSGDAKGNCNPGLVVDRDIVHSVYPDFYLLSHSGIIGTSRPSHYVVLRNDAQWSSETLQEISYDLCHVYAPATRAVSIPAPVYYADKLCTHAKYQFAPVDGLADWDDLSDGGEAVFDLAKWQERLQPSRLWKRMYFI